MNLKVILSTIQVYPRSHASITVLIAQTVISLSSYAPEENVVFHLYADSMDVKVASACRDLSSPVYQVKVASM